MTVEGRRSDGVGPLEVLSGCEVVASFGFVAAPYMKSRGLITKLPDLVKKLQGGIQTGVPARESAPELGRTETWCPDRRGGGDQKNARGAEPAGVSPGPEGPSIPELDQVGGSGIMSM